MKPITPRGYLCGTASSEIVVNGKLDEDAWQSAPWTEDFVDIEADRRPKPRQQTRAKMLWDSQYLYIAAEIAEKHVQGTITNHDEVIFHDNDFEVFIDPDGDNHEYYEFEINALNTTWDLFLPRPYKDGGSADNSWEFAGLKSAVHVSGTINDPSDVDSGWSLEIAIPWKAFQEQTGLSIPPADGDRWRMDFSRVEWQFDIVDGHYRKVPKTREDNWVWSPQGIVDMHRPERWGFVQFSSEPPDDKPFLHDASLAIQDSLMEIYHRQRAYHQQNKKWATDWKSLEFEPGIANTLFLIETTPDGYRASFVETREGGSNKIWYVRQDSKLWSVSENQVLQDALSRAGANRNQLERALRLDRDDEKEAMEFLIANMPDRDLTSLSASFLIENVRLALAAMKAAPWKDTVPTETFLNSVLPYANINEGREPWREDFHTRFLPLIEGAKTPSEAAALLNQKLFSLVNVKYSTQRAKADQCPTESIRSGLASCTGLSILLIDACRAVGVPARFVGTPLWSDKSGNHSWVEIWDDGWHFTGAAEPTGSELDKAWFIARAGTARRDDELNAIYAVSFQKTPLKFPLVWDRSIDYVHAVNVTDRYTQLRVKKPEGTSLLRLRVIDSDTRRRVAADVRILDKSGNEVFVGQAKDERFDSNDHLQTYLPFGQEYTIEAADNIGSIKHTYHAESEEKTLTIAVPRSKTVSNNLPQANPPTKAQVDEMSSQLWKEHVARIRATRADEMKAQSLEIGNLKMPFSYEIFGEKPASGRSMFISMHGGGGAPAKVNSQQWENQKKLYKLDEGVYVVPRAPTDAWDLWHQAHIDLFFDRLIENFIALEDVDPNRVYIMGYSAGGDGVYQLAPRMADRFAAAAMMAGHPNETSPLGLRNLPFTLHMGGNDNAYNRNKVAAEWAAKLADLQREDPEGYVHFVKIHKGKGHWMDRQDAEALPWMAKHVRNPFPNRIVWKQDDVVSQRFFWLSIEPSNIRERALVRATRAGQHFDIQSRDVDQVAIRFNDTMIDFDQPIKVTSGQTVLYEGQITRSTACVQKTFAERHDPTSVFSAELVVKLR